MATNYIYFVTVHLLPASISLLNVTWSYYPESLFVYISVARKFLPLTVFLLSFHIAVSHEQGNMPF